MAVAEVDGELRGQEPDRRLSGAVGGAPASPLAGRLRIGACRSTGKRMRLPSAGMTSLVRSPSHDTRRALAVLSACLIAVTALATPASAGDSPSGDVAVAWPASWEPYRYASGSPVVDSSDENPGYSDLWAGSGDDRPTVYFASDGANVFFRTRVRNDPASKNGGFNSTSWLASIAVGGTQAAVVGLNGKPSATDFVYASNADGSVTRQIYTTPFSNDGAGTSAGARVVGVPDEGYFVDFQIPIVQITAVAPSVTGTTPVQIYFGTSQAANLSVINKDFMVGDAVSYVGLATVRLDGDDAAPPNTPPTTRPRPTPRRMPSTIPSRPPRTPPSSPRSWETTPTLMVTA